LVLNARVRADSFHDGPLFSLGVALDRNSPPPTQVDAATVRAPGEWFNVSLRFQHPSNKPISVRLNGNGNGNVEIDYFEIFPDGFNVTMGPGSGPYADSDLIQIERAKTDIDVPHLAVNGQDSTHDLELLVQSGAATIQAGDFRSLLTAKVSDLAVGKTGTLEVFVGDQVRMEILREPPPCAYEGDPTANTKVLITGFQPFPPSSDHENISTVAVQAARLSELPGIQLMRLILPVEFDRAPAELSSAIQRCQPNVVVSFGQGGLDINVEPTAYNLKDTGDLPLGAPDNRGFVVSSQLIAPGDHSTRASLLPVNQIEQALRAIGESPQPSVIDRYVCNDLFFSEVAAVDGTGTTAGFVHLPYTSDFPDDVRARWGKVVETVVRTAAGH
jgi:pyroglutamyl-peptidase